jgi:Raf kinase inhibitor-like YbhB/YbcL family protein
MKLTYSVFVVTKIMKEPIKIFIHLVFLFMFMLAGCKNQTGNDSVGDAADMSIQVTSIFNDGEKIPQVYTCDGGNISPPLSWSGVPSNTASLALIMDDPDAPAGTWVHWVLYNLQPDLTGIEQGKSGGGTQGINDFKRLGYGGPCPPKGTTHRYFIKVYALDTMLDLKSGATKAELESLMRGHIMAQGQLVGKYGR